MKAQFKYAFRTGINTRGWVFSVIFVMELVFIVLASLGWLPNAAQITAVSLGGVAIAVMMAFNIISDIAIARRMFNAPGAYLYALTPAPRKQILFSSIVSMLVLDAVTMAAVIIGEVWMAFNLAGEDIPRVVAEAIRANAGQWYYVLLMLAFFIAGYFLFLTIILFSVSVKRSVLSDKPASGLLAALVAAGTVYVLSLLPIILAPFGSVSRFGVFFSVSLGRLGTVLYLVLTCIEAAALFVLTSRLLERKVNI